MRVQQNTCSREGDWWSEEGERESQMGQQSASFTIFVRKHNSLAISPADPLKGGIIFA
jgi:hypothetical protein